MTFRKMAIEVLKKSVHPLSVVEIWREAEQTGLTKKLNTKGINPYGTFRSVLYTDFKNTKRTFNVHGNKPKKFSLTET